MSKKIYKYCCDKTYQSQIFNLIQTYHYSHLVPSIRAIRKASGLLTEETTLVAGILWSIPASSWKEPVLELSRLVRLPDTRPPLTKLISQSVKEIIKEKQYNLLISYADATHDHHGGVYQAASWKYSGVRKGRLDAFLIDGVRVPCRTCNHRYGTSSIKLIEILGKKGHKVIPCISKDKHLYWRALSKEGIAKAERLGLKDLPYPKPNSSAKTQE